MISKKQYKVIYKLREKYGERKLKDILFYKYGINITLNKLKHIIENIPYSRDKYSEIDKKRILYLYSNYVNTSKLVSYLNKKYKYDLTERRIIDYASRNNVKKKFQNMYSQAFITRNQEYEIAKQYLQGKSSTELAKQYNYKTRNSILQKLHKLDIKTRNVNLERAEAKSYIDFNLKKVDTQLKGYILGLLLTDGYINIERGYIGLELVDLDTIRFISKELKCKYATIKSDKFKNRYRIILYCKEYLDCLNRLGLIKAKTFMTEGPVLFSDEKQYLPFIVRGIIDGDGWIRKDGGEFFICSASEKFIKWCKEALEELKFVNIKIRFIANDFNGIYIIRSAVIHNINLLQNLIYKQPFGMMRKYNLLHKKDVQRL